ncbi:MULTISPECIES: TetR/AcrR family transcriptional regulator [unclassified Streptomyces]|uniref:TetR/AcrR family transcriptional regulator n=1 Tax=unclassified Streptomyces TaxID=2593676 RepID=UPI001BE7A03A|nr:TetR/AcrR family transcriptional regulator [Streptomyces sp. McG3]MBT2897013.1 TetR/AcrR family transcriptional regulator [Streptomyces sp. McG3]
MPDNASASPPDPRERLRLRISREATRLFLSRGTAGTSGDRIAEKVGVSTRTIWRHFRNKESCAEPIALRGLDWELSALRGWPPGISLDAHLTAEAAHFTLDQHDSFLRDFSLSARLVHLTRHEPALRIAWLMACDHAEHELTVLLAHRAGLPAHTPHIRVNAAAGAAALRVLHESRSTDPALRAGRDTPSAHAPRTATVLARVICPRPPNSTARLRP